MREPQTKVRVRREGSPGADQFVRLPAWLFDAIEDEARRTNRSFSHAAYLFLKQSVERGSLPQKPTEQL